MERIILISRNAFGLAGVVLGLLSILTSLVLYKAEQYVFSVFAITIATVLLFTKYRLSYYNRIFMWNIELIKPIKTIKSIVLMSEPTNFSIKTINKKINQTHPKTNSESIYKKRDYVISIKTKVNEIEVLTTPDKNIAEALLSKLKIIEYGIK